MLPKRGVPVSTGARRTYMSAFTFELKTLERSELKQLKENVEYPIPRGLVSRDPARQKEAKQEIEIELERRVEEHPRRLAG